MDVLEHPWEAVAFRLYSLPVPEASAATGAAAWTCLAAAVLAAAAAGVWRLYSSPSPSAAVAVAASANTSELDASPVAEVSPETSRPAQRAREPATAATPKERYTAYYRDAGCVGCCDAGDESDDEEEEEEHEDGEGDVFLSDDGSTGPFGWEVVRSLPLSPAAAEMGRYRRSPTTGLSGSVVQLWDQGAVGGLAPAASPRRRARVVVGTVSAF